MADYGADAAVVHGVLGLRIEERGLQNGGWEHDDITGGLVVRVHRLRVHEPFALVHRLAALRNLIAELVDGRRPHVVHERGIGMHVERRVVAPSSG